MAAAAERAEPEPEPAAEPQGGLPLRNELSQATTNAAIRQLFEVFDADKDGFLNQEEYSTFCLATEGEGCDDERCWCCQPRASPVCVPAAGPAGDCPALGATNRSCWVSSSEIGHSWPRWSRVCCVESQVQGASAAV